MTGDSPSARERLYERYANRRFFNENLAPLRRFLHKQVGRPWDKVHAEICERIDRGNVVQKHILTHLTDFVVTRVREENGGLFDADRGGRWRLPLSESRRELYVCPRTGWSGGSPG